MNSDVMAPGTSPIYLINKKIKKKKKKYINTRHARLYSGRLIFMLRIEYLMHEQGKTQTDVSRASGVHRVTVNRVVNGREIPTNDCAQRLAKAFSWPLDRTAELFEEVEIAEIETKEAKIEQCAKAIERKTDELLYIADVLEEHSVNVEMGNGRYLNPVSAIRSKVDVIQDEVQIMRNEALS